MVPVFPGRQGILWRCSQFLVVFRISTFDDQFSPRLIPLQKLASRPEGGDGGWIRTSAAAVRRTGAPASSSAQLSYTIKKKSGICLGDASGGVR